MNRRMKWRKLGQIFDPSSATLPNGCREFAQSPQALVFPDFVRIYFSTRSTDPSGKYLSHVAFVDFEKDFRHAIRASGESVVPLGELGAFDEHGIFPFSPVRDGEAVLAYTCGWSRRISVSVETGIGLARSRDGGLSFEKVGHGPILSSSLHEPCLVGDAFVRHFGGEWHMWYIFGLGWKRYSEAAPPDRTYKIGHAVSPNGFDWLKDGRRIVADRLGPDESQALPTVIHFGDRYHMFFCYRESSDFRSNRGRGYRIGHAESEDLTTWIRDDAALSLEPTSGTWDSDMLCYPHVFECNSQIYMLYNGNAFGKHGFGLAILEAGQ